MRVTRIETVYDTRGLQGTDGDTKGGLIIAAIIVDSGLVAG
jgi:hypothetical protein